MNAVAAPPPTSPPDPPNQPDPPDPPTEAGHLGARPAPVVRRVLAQARFEAGILLHNGEQLLVSLVLPAMALVGLTKASVPDLGSNNRIDVVVPGVLALAVISSAFTGQAIQTGFDRRYGVLRMFGTTPLGRGGLLAGKSVGLLAVLGVQIAVLSGLGFALGWSPQWTGVPAALLFALAGTAAFVALALLIAGTLRAEAVLAVANLVWLLLVVGGAVLVPASTLPASVEFLAGWLPSGALGEGLRAALLDGTLDLRSLLVLLGWFAGTGLAARRLFRWS